MEAAEEVLKEAERRIRTLLQEAAAEGDYDAVAPLAGLAKQVGTMVEGRRAPSTRPSRPGPPKPKRRKVSAVKTTKKTRKTNSRSKKRAGYPKFRREGDHLIKVGWSKTDKAEYEHRAPKAVVDALVAALVAEASEGSLVTMDAVLPLLEKDGTELPAYQAYLCLAWMRAEGLVDARGRKGYSIAEGVDLAADVDGRWNRRRK